MRFDENGQLNAHKLIPAPENYFVDFSEQEQANEAMQTVAAEEEISFVVVTDLIVGPDFEVIFNMRRERTDVHAVSGVVYGVVRKER